MSVDSCEKPSSTNPGTPETDTNNTAGGSNTAVSDPAPPDTSEPTIAQGTSDVNSANETSDPDSDPRLARRHSAASPENGERTGINDPLIARLVALIVALAAPSTDQDGVSSAPLDLVSLMNQQMPSENPWDPTPQCMHTLDEMGCEWVDPEGAEKG